jgi:hypothetical protein
MVNTYIGGTLQFKIDGTQYRLGGQFKYMLGGQVRKAKNGLDSTLGFVTTYSEAKMDCELVVDGVVSVSSLKAITNSTLVATLDNGRTVVLLNAWQDDGDIEVDAKEATATVKFAALSAQEL